VPGLSSEASACAGTAPIPDVPPGTEPPSFIQKCLPRLSEAERQALMEMLQTEYIHLLPLVQLGIANANSVAEETANS